MSGSMFSDIRFVARSLSRAKLFTIGALLTFALGMGANLAVFAVVDRVLFRPLPFDDPDRLVTIHPVDPKSGRVYFMFPRAVAVELRRSATAIHDLAYAGNSRPYWLEGRENAPLRLTEVSFNALGVLGVRPIMGRAFSRDDAAAGVRLVLLRDELWRSRFGADPDVVKRQFSDSSGPAQVVGILPAGFVNPSVNWATPTDGLILAPDLLEASEARPGVPAVFARLRSDATLAQVRDQVDATIAAVQSTRPEEGRLRTRVEPIQKGIFWNARASLMLLFAGGVLVWMIASLNLGALVGARASSQYRHLAVRASLGASRWQVCRLVLVEAALLALSGSVVALLVLVWTIDILGAWIPSYVGQMVLTAVDSRTLGFALATGIVGCALAVVSPAWKAYTLPQFTLLQPNPEPLRARGARRALVFLQASIATALLLAGSLTVKSFAGLLLTDLGFEPDGLYGVSLRMDVSDPLMAQPDAITRTTEHLARLPGVTAVSIVDLPLGSSENPRLSTVLPGAQMLQRRIGRAYFGVMRTPLIAGRTFDEAEVLGNSQAAIMSVDAARRLWPDATPSQVLGQTVEIEGERPRVVVGLVGDTRPRHGLAVVPEIFVPWEHDGSGAMPTFLLRASPGWLPSETSLRRELHLAHGRPVGVAMFDSSRYIRSWLDDPRLYAYLFGAFGLLALALTTVGLCALTAYNTSLRRHEIGVRSALGATPLAIERWLVGAALRPVLAGITAGVATALWYAKFLEGLLHDVSARDAAIYALTVLVFLTAATIAAWIPASQASRANPLMALRSRQE